MASALTGSFSQDIRQIVAAIRTVPIAGHPISNDRDSSPPPTPFFTISRQAGAGGHTVARALVDRLNRHDPGERAWTCWDRELIEKVAEEHHLSKALLESLEHSSRSWLEEFLGGLSSGIGGGSVNDVRVYHLVAATIRALAQAGRVVIVGRGGIYITRDMAGGIHLRLVAPLAHRIDHMSRLENLSRIEAAAGPPT